MSPTSPNPPNLSALRGCVAIGENCHSGRARKPAPYPCFSRGRLDTGLGETRNPGKPCKIRPFWISRRLRRGMTNYDTASHGGGLTRHSPLAGKGGGDSPLFHPPLSPPIEGGEFKRMPFIPALPGGAFWRRKVKLVVWGRPPDRANKCLISSMLVPSAKPLWRIGVIQSST